MHTGQGRLTRFETARLNMGYPLYATYFTLNGKMRAGYRYSTIEEAAENARRLARHYVGVKVKEFSVDQSGAVQRVLIMTDVQPYELGIEATLGRETCQIVEGKCDKCGAIVYDRPNFCGNCGRKVADE